MRKQNLILCVALSLASTVFSFPHEEYKREEKSSGLACDDMLMTFRQSLPFAHAYKTITGCQMRTWGSQQDTINATTRVKTPQLVLVTDTSGTTVALDSMLTGAATNPNDTVRCTRIAFMVQCRQVGGISATSNTGAFTFGPLPAGYRPIGTVVVDIARVTDNGVVRHGVGSIATTGIVTVSKSDTDGVYSATFTSSGTKAIGAGTVLTFPRF